MHESLAKLVLVTPAMTLLRAKVEVTIPRKRRGSCTQHEKVSIGFMTPSLKGLTDRELPKSALAACCKSNSVTL